MMQLRFWMCCKAHQKELFFYVYFCFVPVIVYLLNSAFVQIAKAAWDIAT